MPKIQGTEEGGSQKVGRGRIERRVDSLLVLAQVVYDVSRLLEEQLFEGPSAARIDLRMGRHRLHEAFPRLQRTAADLAQLVAEEDGDGQDY